MLQYLQEAAWGFLVERDITALPVEPLSLASQMGIKVLSYKKYSAIVKRPLENIKTNYDQDGFAFFSGKEGHYIICYNSDLPFSVCRWTLMHEIAHIYLRHITPETPLQRRARNRKGALF